MTKFCNKCNYPIEEGGAFCSECGSSDIRDSSAPQPLPEMDEQKDKGTIQDTSTGTGMITPIANSSVESEEIPDIVPLPSNGLNNDEKIRDAIKNTYDINPAKNDSPAPMMSTPAEPIPGPGSNLIEIPKGFRPDEDDDEENNTTSISNGENQELITPLGSNSNIALKRMNARKKKQNSKTLFIFLGIGFCVVVSVLLLFVFYYGKAVAAIEGPAVVEGPFKPSDLQAAGSTTPTVDYSTIFTPENSYRVGDPNFGYFSIPNTWIKFADVNENNTLQFTDNGTWIVTLYGVPTNQLSAVNWANNVYNGLNQSGAKNVTTTVTTINGYPALAITAYYSGQEKYLTTWFLESRSGITHYLAIEGPSNTGDNFNIIYSFKDDQ